MQSINDLLFNCMTNLAEPDWLQFANIEVHPMKTRHHESDGGTYTDHAEPDETPDFWTVFGHFAKDSKEGGGITDITDVPTEEIAQAIASLFEARIAQARKKALDDAAQRQADEAFEREAIVITMEGGLIQDIEFHDHKINIVVLDFDEPDPDHDTYVPETDEREAHHRTVWSPNETAE